MKSYELLEVIGEAQDSYVIDAKAPKKKSTPVWVKWATMAACLCFVVAGIFSLAQNSNHSKHKAPTVLFGGSEYYICGSRGESIILKDCGLPTELSFDLAGTFVSYLDYDGECYYTPTDKETGFVMYEYKPEPNANVLIVVINDICYAAIKREGDTFYGVNGNFYKPE